MNAHEPLHPGRLLLGLAFLGLFALSCARNPPVVEPVPPEPPPGAEQITPVAPSAPRARQSSPPLFPPEPPPPLPEEEFVSRPLEEINREAPLQPVFFGYDSSEIDAAARGVIATNADVLSQNPTWVVAIEGHCDSRGTPEYNLALGERRAYAVRDHLVGLGISADRMQTISYGEEFPFVPGETEDAWSANRRAHFVVTGQ